MFYKATRVLHDLVLVDKFREYIINEWPKLCKDWVQRINLILGDSFA